MPSSRWKHRSRDYVIEKLTDALRILATGKGDARQRVADAFQACVLLTVGDFPVELQQRWRWIKDEATTFRFYENRPRGVLPSKVEAMMPKRKNATAAKVAKGIWDLYWEVSKNRQYW
jgi:hypothetical protein